MIAKTALACSLAIAPAAAFAVADGPDHFNTRNLAAGQRLTVAMKASNPQAYFNVSPPGSAPAAMFNGSMEGKFDSVLLPDDGEYEVKVYLMRAAARRNEHASYTLTVTLEGQALKPVPAAQDALVKGTRYHATATIPCTPPFGLKAPSHVNIRRPITRQSGIAEMMHHPNLGKLPS
jgi:hypothetical protein